MISQCHSFKMNSTTKIRIHSSNMASSSSFSNRKKSLYDHKEVAVPANGAPTAALDRNAAIRLKIQGKGPVCNSRRKVSPSRSAHKLKENGDYIGSSSDSGWPDDDTCLWLSAGSSSPSSCFDDQIFGNLLDFSLDDWLVSCSILPRNCSSIFYDGSRVNPVEERNSLEEEITISCSETSETQISGWPMIWDHQNSGFFDSLIDLDGENSDWFHDMDFSFLKMDFLSPCYESSGRPDAESSSSASTSGSLTVTECKDNASTSSISNISDTESLGLEDARFGEPLSWPSDHIFDWRSEFSWDSFVMSPCKDKCEAGNSKGDLHDRVQLALRNAKTGLSEEHKVWLKSRLAAPRTYGTKIQRQRKTKLG